jgi:hypothetical protein
MRRVVVAVLAVSIGSSFITAPAISQNRENRGNCESIIDKVRRIQCFQRLGMPTVDCKQPQSGDDVAFCRELADRAAKEMRRHRDEEKARDDQQRRFDAVLLDEAQRGYHHVTLKDLYLDGKKLSANQTKVAVAGFYKAYNRHDERLLRFGRRTHFR